MGILSLGFPRNHVGFCFCRFARLRGDHSIARDTLPGLSQQLIPTENVLEECSRVNPGLFAHVGTTADLPVERAVLSKTSD